MNSGWREGRVFVAGVTELLNGLDRHGVQRLFPALDGGRAVARHLGQQLLDEVCLRVVGVDRECYSFNSCLRAPRGG